MTQAGNSGCVSITSTQLTLTIRHLSTNTTNTRATRQPKRYLWLFSLFLANRESRRRIRTLQLHCKITKFDEPAYALVANPDNIQNHLKAVSGFIPEEVILIFSDQVGSIAAANETLGLNFIVGLLVATWSAHRGVDALVRAITVAYLEKETRGIIRRNVITYLLTIGAVLCTVFILTLMIGIPALFVTLKLPHWITVMTGIGVWILFLSVAILAISILYRFGPPRRPANWRWLSPGAMAATLLWLCGSAGFSYYVSQFGTYNETYGALSAIVVLLIWFYLTSYAIVLGASLNAEIEHQTRHDTTVGDQRPMGQRDAYVADHLGQSATDS